MSAKFTFECHHLKSMIIVSGITNTMNKYTNINTNALLYIYIMFMNTIYEQIIPGIVLRLTTNFQKLNFISVKDL